LGHLQNIGKKWKPLKQNALNIIHLPDWMTAEIAIAEKSVYILSKVE
jgi:hypothetical protein